MSGMQVNDQSVQVEAPIVQTGNSAPAIERRNAQSPLQADAFLKIDTDGGQGSTCAILTPSIKRKLGEMSSGQVLEVRVDDPSAKEDIEAWSRLSGNSLLRINEAEGTELRKAFSRYGM